MKHIMSIMICQKLSKTVYSKMLNYMGGAGFHIIFAHANILFFFFRMNLYDSDTKKKKE